MLQPSKSSDALAQPGARVLMRPIACAVTVEPATIDAMPAGSPFRRTSPAMLTQTSDRTPSEHPMSHVRPSVIFGLGVAVALLGVGIIYFGALSKASDSPLLGLLPNSGFAAWTIGGLLLLIADIAWAVAVGLRLAKAP